MHSVCKLQTAMRALIHAGNPCAQSIAEQALTRRLADTEDFPDIEQMNLDSIIDNPATDDEDPPMSQPK